MSSCKCLRWAFRITDWEPRRSEWLQIVQSIQEEETRRVMRFVFREDAKRAAIGRVLLRASVVKVFDDVAWSHVRFGRSEKGKPILAEPSTTADCPSFNISHDGDYVVLATNCGASCGVDVMKVQFRPSSMNKTIDEYLNLMRGQFSTTEWSTMERAGSEMEKLNLFYRYWCLKESYVKATGIGIHNELTSVDFRYPNDDYSTSRTPTLYLYGRSASDRWRFREYRLGSDHVAAVCTGVNVGSNLETGWTKEEQQGAGWNNSIGHCRGVDSEFEHVSLSQLLNDAQRLHSVDESDVWEKYSAKSYKEK